MADAKLTVDFTEITGLIGEHDIVSLQYWPTRGWQALVQIDDDRLACVQSLPQHALDALCHEVRSFKAGAA